MDQVSISIPSYWTRRRRIKSCVSTFLENCEHPDQMNLSGPCTSDDHVNNDDCPIRCLDFVESVDTTEDETDINCYDGVGDDDCMFLSDSDDECDAFLDAEDGVGNYDEEFSLRDELAGWALQFNVPQVAVNTLLQILHQYHSDLPLDSRSLLSTPRSTMITKLPGGGEYIHFGLKRGIEEMINSSDLASFDGHLKLQFNVDGLPLFKSSGKCIWPILCMISQSSLKEPFVVGIFCGISKPHDLNAFFADFVDECQQLAHDGIRIGDHNLCVELHSFVCDAPARAMIKNVKSHGGYYACDKCTQEGEWHGKVTYLQTTAALRTDIQFDEMTDEEHHLGPSPLHSLPIGMVSGFPLDYMHLVCLGVMRRLMLSWLKGPLAVRLSASQVEQLSKNLLKFVPFIPREFFS